MEGLFESSWSEAESFLVMLKEMLMNRGENITGGMSWYQKHMLACLFQPIMPKLVVIEMGYLQAFSYSIYYCVM